mmetsp:Transcript_18715/g.44423  ORF Transcript_18715/g.44423 Transcript_18715/m.44423 type:complete len:80 (+) Transcript_18715:158-397(+)
MAASPCGAVASSIPSYWWLCQVVTWPNCQRKPTKGHAPYASLAMQTTKDRSKASGGPQLLQGPELDCTQLYSMRPENKT